MSHGDPVMEFMSLKEEEEGPELTLSLPMWDTVGRSASQEEGPPRNHIFWHLGPGTSQPPELWQINVCCLNHALCDILIWKLGQTHIVAQGHVIGLCDARKMLLESGFLFTQSKNELWEHTGSKQASKVFIIGKQIAPRASGRGEENPLLYCLIGVFIP